MLRSYQVTEERQVLWSLQVPRCPTPEGDTAGHSQPHWHICGESPFTPTAHVCISISRSQLLWLDVPPHDSLLALISVV